LALIVARAPSKAHGSRSGVGARAYPSTIAASIAAEVAGAEQQVDCLSDEIGARTTRGSCALIECPDVRVVELDEYLAPCDRHIVSYGTTKNTKPPG